MNEKTQQTNISIQLKEIIISYQNFEYFFTELRTLLRI